MLVVLEKGRELHAKMPLAGQKKGNMFGLEKVRDEKVRELRRLCTKKLDLEKFIHPEKLRELCCALKKF